MTTSDGANRRFEVGFARLLLWLAVYIFADVALYMVAWSSRMMAMGCGESTSHCADGLIEFAQNVLVPANPWLVGAVLAGVIIVQLVGGRTLAWLMGGALLTSSLLVVATVLTGVGVFWPA